MENVKEDKLPFWHVVIAVTPGILYTYLRYEGVNPAGLERNCIILSVLLTCIIVISLIKTRKISLWLMPSLSVLLLIPWTYFHAWLLLRGFFRIEYLIYLILFIIGMVFFIINGKHIRKDIWKALLPIVAISLFRSVIQLISEIPRYRRIIRLGSEIARCGTIKYISISLLFDFIKMNVGMMAYWLLLSIPVLSVGFILYRKYGRDALLFVVAFGSLWTDYYLIPNGTYFLYDVIKEGFLLLNILPLL